LGNFIALLLLNSILRNGEIFNPFLAYFQKKENKADAFISVHPVINLTVFL